MQKKAEKSEVKSIFVEKAGHHPMLEKTSHDYVLSEIVNFLKELTRFARVRNG